jgi:hypothetical protein
MVPAQASAESVSAACEVVPPLIVLSESAREHAVDLATEFQTAEPFRHVVLEGLLPPDACRALIAEFPEFSEKHALNEHGEVGGKAVVPGLARLGPAYAGFDQMMQSADFLQWLSQLTGIPNLLYDPEYVGGGTHENRNGQELDTHVDFNFHPRTQWHRRVNLILFLNPQWHESWGGCLELLRDPFDTNQMRSVTPLANRAVIFETTESSWHGFRRIQLPPDFVLSRRSIAVYFYTKEPSLAGESPSHGTVYYQRPLPDRVRSGYIMREHDVEEVRALLQRRDHHIKFLYQREKEFSVALDGMRNSVAFRLGRMLTSPGRMVRDWWKGKGEPES